MGPISRPQIPPKPKHLSSSTAFQTPREPVRDIVLQNPPISLQPNDGNQHIPPVLQGISDPQPIPEDQDDPIPQSRLNGSPLPVNVKKFFEGSLSASKDRAATIFRSTNQIFNDDMKQRISSGTSAVIQGFDRFGRQINHVGDDIKHNMDKAFTNIPVPQPVRDIRDDIVDLGRKGFSDHDLCSQCRSLPIEGCYEDANSESTETHWTTPLSRLLFHWEWCRMCELLLSMLCRPECDPLRHPEISRYMQTEIKEMDMKTWVGEGWKFTQDHWPFGRGEHRHEGATRALGTAGDIFWEAVTSPELMPARAAFGALVKGHRNIPRNQRSLTYHDGVKRGRQQMKAYTKYPLGCDLHMTIRKSKHPEHPGMAFVSLIGYGNRPGGDPQVLSAFRLRVVHPAMGEHPNIMRSLSYGSLIDRDWINLSIVSRWLAHCAQNHGKRCSQHSWGIAIQPPRFLRVIDIVDMRLVEVSNPADCRFVALSYVWGRSDTVMLRSSNIDSFRQLHGLEKVLKNLPRTLIDAMEVVRGLGERYLWVDSLCILQEDTREAQEQIAAMDRVYGSSFLTIAAAQGDNADHGLWGIERKHFASCGPGRPRDLRQPSAQIRDNVQMIAPFSYRGSLTDTAWNSRAWTFQERVLSKRVLLFCGNEVIWNCREMVCREDMQVQDSGYGPEPLQWLTLKPQYFGQDIDAHWVDGSLMTDRHGRTRVVRSGTFTQYANIIEEYTSRRLTFESDATRALEGLLHVFQLSFKSEFICGLPTSLLDVALLWRPVQRLERRSQFPSWSWAGWKGQISYNKVMEVERDDTGSVQSAKRAYSGEEGIRSLVRWHILRRPSNDLERINGHGWGIPFRRIPPEWEASQHGADAFQPSFLDAAHHRHLLENNMPHLLFRTTAVGSFELADQVFQGSDTERLNLKAFPKPAEPCPLRFSIVDSRFEWIGTVILDGSGPEWLDKRKHEFILISEAQYFGLDGECYDVGEFPNYLVMLVERDNRTGICTRLGLGRVKKTAWMMAQPTERVVMLG